MAHIHNVFDTEPRYEINPVKRTISHLSKDEEFIVQGDHNSERFAFEIPRYIDGHDMLLCDVVRIHYINIGTDNQRKEDVYEVDDIQTNPDNPSMLVFSWLITANATSLAGTLNFAIQFKCTTNGKIDYAWHTVPYTGIKISSSLNSSEAVDVEISDILDTWYARLVESGNEGVDRVEEATSAALTRINEESSNFANAIRTKAKGDVLRIYGVSSITHPVNVQLKSKNLFMVPYARTLDGVTLSIDGEGVVHLNGTAEKSGNFQVETIIDKAGKYYLADFAEGTFPSDENSRCQVYQPSTSVSIATRNNSASAHVTSGTFKVDYVWIRIRFENGFTYNDCKLKPTLFYEETPTEYIPYVSDLSSVTVRASGKNLFNINEVDKFFDKTATQSPTIAYVEDGVLINHMGTYGNFVMCNPNIKMLHKGTYTLSFDVMCGRTSGVKHIRVIVQFKDNTYVAIVNKTLDEYQKWTRLTGTITLEEDKELWGIGFQNGGAEGDYTNLDTRFKNILLEYDVDSDTGYSDFVGGSYNSDSNGSLSIPSISPTMTLFTDTAGVIVNAEYNRDTGHYLQELKDLIISSGTSVNATLADTETGDFYRLAVSNGKLTLEKLEV